MKYALYMPNFGTSSDPKLVADLAREAEEVGWDGFFLSDNILWTDPQNQPVGDPWVMLAAIALATSRVRLGTMITPLPRRRPWTVARQATTIDHLSNGRLILSVGTGGDWHGDFSAFGEPADDKTHGELLDEALAIIAGLWRGEPFSFDGAHYQVKNAQFLPRPVQQPRIPIWVGGVWPHKKPFRRGAGWDGVAAEGGVKYLTPQDYREILPYIAKLRDAAKPFDVSAVGETSGNDPASVAKVAAYAEAGVTWWLEWINGGRDSLAQMRQRIRQGPPDSQS
jgi:alkanesulfonate monooxygenase SsuD/methylene tetrahydromethanopterin reductase-like flavin-dependent oxidoreductase (luciferase family)